MGEPDLHVGSMSESDLLLHNVIVACWSMSAQDLCLNVGMVLETFAC